MKALKTCLAAASGALALERGHKSLLNVAVVCVEHVDAGGLNKDFDCARVCTDGGQRFA